MSNLPKLQRTQPVVPPETRRMSTFKYPKDILAKVKYQQSTHAIFPVLISKQPAKKPLAKEKRLEYLH
jgi:hypothetical protein